MPYMPYSDRHLIGFMATSVRYLPSTVWLQKQTNTHYKPNFLLCFIWKPLAKEALDPQNLLMLREYSFYIFSTFSTKKITFAYLNHLYPIAHKLTYSLKLSFNVQKGQQSFEPPISWLRKINNSSYEEYCS
jgi:hypothetical protein